MKKNKKLIKRLSPYFTPKDIREYKKMVSDILSSGQLTMGKYTKKFEEEFSKKIGVKYAISVNSGTSALEIVLQCIGIENKKVLVPSFTFIATCNAVVRAGGIPVFCDIDPETLSINPKEIKRKITPKTKAIIFVYPFGLIPPYMEEIVEICEKKGIFLIEDAAHAHGASINGKKAGSIGVAGCFSFYPTKIITTGEGGMITTNDKEIMKKALILRNHGYDSQKDRFIWVSSNFRLPELSAALGLIQLRNLDYIIQKRIKIAEVYNKYLRKIKKIRILPQFKNIINPYWNYIIILNEKINREKFAKLLKNKYNIEVAYPYYPPVHLNPAQKKYAPLKGLPATEKITKKHLALPIHPSLKYREVIYIIKSLIKELE